jgi:predicted ATPase
MAIELQPELKELPTPRIERLLIQNYRVLRNLQLRGLSPMTVFIGPNGVGKSTLFDVFSFLAECLSVGLRKAWDKRGRFRELRSRGADGPIVIEIGYREGRRRPLITYHLAIDEGPRGPFVAQEWLRWKRGSYGRPFRFLDFAEGRGQVISGAEPEIDDKLVDSSLASPELLALNTIGQLSDNPRVVSLRSFVEDWYLSYLSLTDARGTPEAGPQERLSASGDNLPNVIQYLGEQHPERLKQIVEALKRRVPGMGDVVAEPLADGRLMLRIKDVPFEEPILARFASDGTIKMLAYLVLLRDPHPPALLGIEEPENFLHPRLLTGLAEECRELSAGSQVFVSTHSPFFLNGLDPSEVWVMDRDSSGYATTQRVSDMPGALDMSKSGSQLGFLWMEGYFTQGDPLKRPRP